MTWMNVANWNLLNQMVVQGDPNQNFPFPRPITLKVSTSDPKLVKPKLVWEVAVFFWKIVNKQLKKLPFLKHILALPTWGQKSLISELQPFEKGNFDLGHPVDHFDEIFYLLWPNFINVMFVQQKKITFAKYSFHGTDSR